jgi:hypothetical protein
MTTPELTSEMIPVVADEPSQEEMRSRIMELEAALLELPENQRVHLEPKHYFAPGIYMRELAIPKNVTLTGAIHKTEHFCFLSKGKVSVGGMGGPTEVFEAPCVVRSLPGVKRAIYAHEDSIWTNIHHNPTNEQNLEKIWEIFTAKTFEEALGHQEQKSIDGGSESCPS